MSGRMVSRASAFFALLYLLGGCARSSGAARAGQPEPSYQSPPLPAWSAPPAESDVIDPAALDGEVVEEQPTLDEPPGTSGEGETQSPQKPLEPEKSVDGVSEASQNSSTAPSDRGTVAPPQSD